MNLSFAVEKRVQKATDPRDFVVLKEWMLQTCLPPSRRVCLVVTSMHGDVLLFVDVTLSSIFSYFSFFLFFFTFTSLTFVTAISFPSIFLQNSFLALAEHACMCLKYRENSRRLLCKTFFSILGVFSFCRGAS